MPYADERINGCTAQSLTRAIHTALPGAELTSLQPTDQRLGSLRLRERADLLTNALFTDVPGDYAELARVVRRKGRHPGVRRMADLAVTSAIATKAVAEPSDDAFDDAMAILADLTGRLNNSPCVPCGGTVRAVFELEALGVGPSAMCRSWGIAAPVPGRGARSDRSPVTGA